MGKMIYLIMAVIIIQISIWIVLTPDNLPGSTLWELFLNPQTSWSSLSLTALISDTISGIAIGGIIIGTFIFKSDFIVLASFAGVVFTFGKTIANLWQALYEQVGHYAGNNVASLGASLVAGTLVLFYIFVILEFWRGRD